MDRFYLVQTVTMTLVLFVFPTITFFHLLHTFSFLFEHIQNTVSLRNYFYH